jgi:hypothetical protein
VPATFLMLPVVTVILRESGAALDAMMLVHVALSPFVIATGLTAMLGPKFAEVPPIEELGPVTNTFRGRSWSLPTERRI